MGSDDGCTEPAGSVGAMIASVNANACGPLSAACDATLDSISQLDAIPANFKAGLIVADVCPCSCAGTLTHKYTLT